MSSYDLVTVGRCSMDLFAQDIGAEFADITGFDASVGGSPTNLAIAASRLGLATAAFTAVGDDRVGDFVLRYLADEGVATGFVVRKPGKRTPLALVGVQPPSEFPLSFYRDDPPDIYLTIEDAEMLPWPTIRSVELSGNVFSRGTKAATARYVLERAKAAGATTFMDLDLRPTEWAMPEAFGLSFRSVVGMIDVAIGTEEEFYAALMPDPGPVAGGAPVPDSAHDELDAAVEGLLEAGSEAIVIKRGPRGATIFLRGKRLDVPGFPVEPLNTVGAGDAFAGGFITSRLQGRDWHDAARFANACGAVVVTRHGCAAAFPRQDEVEAFVAGRGGW